MKKTYGKLKNIYFKKPDTCCTSSEWYLKYIFSELTVQYLIFHDKNANGEKLDNDLQFPDWNCWDCFMILLINHLYENEEDMEEYINAPYYYNRKHFKKLVKIIPYMLIERNVSVHAVINLIIIFYTTLMLQLLLHTLHVIMIRVYSKTQINN